VELKSLPTVAVSTDLLDAIRSFPVQREVEHCGGRWTVSPFDLYTSCPDCGTRLKVRTFSALPELEDLFDAVFEWLSRPEARDVACRRQADLEAGRDE